MSVNVSNLGFGIQMNHEMSFKCEYTQNEESQAKLVQIRTIR